MGRWRGREKWRCILHGRGKFCLSGHHDGFTACYCNIPCLERGPARLQQSGRVSLEHCSLPCNLALLSPKSSQSPSSSLSLPTTWAAQEREPQSFPRGFRARSPECRGQSRAPCCSSVAALPGPEGGGTAGPFPWPAPPQRRRARQNLSWARWWIRWGNAGPLAESTGGLCRGSQIHRLVKSSGQILKIDEPLQGREKALLGINLLQC